MSFLQTKMPFLKDFWAGLLNKRLNKMSDSTIFYLSGQEDISQNIENFLRDFFYKNLNFEKKILPDKFSSNSSEKDKNVMTQFILKLKSAMYKNSQFDICIDNCSQKYYLGYSYGTDNNISIPSDQLNSFFPAVFIFERFCFFPQGLYDILLRNNQAKETLFFLFKEMKYNRSGSFFIDYTNTETVYKYCKFLKDEINQEISCYYNILKKDDFDEDEIFIKLSILLDISKQYIKENKEIIQKKTFEFDVECTNEFLKIGQKNTLILKIINKSDLEFTDVEIELHAPKCVIEHPISSLANFNLNNNVHILSHEVIAKVHPWCPFEIIIKFSDVMTNRPLDPFPIPLLVPTTY